MIRRGFAICLRVCGLWAVSPDASITRGMTPIPNGYDRFAADDAHAMELDWKDVCPAYALALVSRGSYALPQDDAEMEVLWDELGGDSTQLWGEVKDVVVRAWAWLEAHHPDTATPSQLPNG